MADVMVNIASILWIILAFVTFHGLHKWNNRFQKLYDVLTEDMKDG